MSKELVQITPGKEHAFGGGLEGAERTDRETMTWFPPLQSADQLIDGAKDLADARSRDMALNDGYSSGAVALHKDSIVGAQFRLNAKPDWRVLGLSPDIGPEWAEEFAYIAEARFNLAGESEGCYFDASEKMTFTAMVRLVVGAYVMTGEHISVVEYLKPSPTRPFRTALQLITPDRLSNPDGTMDTPTLRRGVRKNARGKTLGYYIRKGHPTEYSDPSSYSWKYVKAELPWGRKQVLHIFEPEMIDQTRGISQMVAALKHARMTKKFSEITLQNAVINATFAGAIESELPNPEIVAALGGTPEAYQQALQSYLGALSSYYGASNNVQIDGAQIPHFFPGTKLNVKPMGTPGGVGSDFEASLLRRVAATLGVSYEELARDYSKVSYSAARASMATTARQMQSRKRMVADRFAASVYALWVEEEIGAGNLPLPPGRNRTDFYRSMHKDAYCRCAFVGSGRGQIDELKETQAAMLRIKANLSTFEDECAMLGKDWREVAEQRSRENKRLEELGVDFSLDATARGKGGAKETLASDSDSQDQEDDQDQEETDEDGDQE